MSEFASPWDHSLQISRAFLDSDHGPGAITAMTALAWMQHEAYTQKLSGNRHGWYVTRNQSRFANFIKYVHIIFNIHFCRYVAQSAPESDSEVSVDADEIDDDKADDDDDDDDEEEQREVGHYDPEVPLDSTISKVDDNNSIQPSK